MTTAEGPPQTGGPALVTGGTGFVGAHLVRALLERGAPNVIASSASGTASNLEDVRDRPYDDRSAQTEWGWRHRFSLGDIIDSFSPT